MTQREPTPLQRRIKEREQPPRRAVPEWVRRMNEGKHPAKDMTGIAA